MAHSFPENERLTENTGTAFTAGDVLPDGRSMFKTSGQAMQIVKRFVLSIRYSRNIIPFNLFCSVLSLTGNKSDRIVAGRVEYWFHIYPADSLLPVQGRQVLLNNHRDLSMHSERILYCVNTKELLLSQKNPS